MTESDKILFKRYLALIGIRPQKPDIDFLNELVCAQMCAVPFENISKLYYYQTTGQVKLPSLEQYLEGIERFHFGGTCYANNYSFHCLLKHLEFEVALCGADMNNPDVHIVNIVTLKDREYLVDVGYAAPFLYALSRDQKEDVIIELGSGRYVLKPQDNTGRSRLEYYSNGQLVHGYRVNPKPRLISEFETAITDSLSERATFRNSILLVRFFAHGLIRLHNLAVDIIDNSKERRLEIADMSMLPEMIQTHFNIPANTVTEAMQALIDFQSPWQ